MKHTLLQGSISESEFLLFKNYVAQLCGIVIPQEKAYLFETRLSKLMLDAKCDSFIAFYRHVISRKDPLMPQKIIDAITTNETQWFRDGTPWQFLEEALLPRFIDKLLSGKKTKIRIWSSAVSTGQEIYSTVMCVDNYLRKNRVKGVELSDFEFFATDISSRVLSIAQKGRYDRISIMRGLSDGYREAYFTKYNASWDIDPRIRDAVRFGHFNLQKSYQPFGVFDIIFCRYVLIYFPDAVKKEVMTKMHHTLDDHGALFTGNYALYDLLSDHFQANHHNNLTYYSKRRSDDEIACG